MHFLSQVKNLKIKVPLQTAVQQLANNEESVRIVVYFYLLIGSLTTDSKTLRDIKNREGAFSRRLLLLFDEAFFLYY